MALARLLKIAALLILLVPAWVGEVRADNGPLAPVDTSSPRATFEAFRTDGEDAFRSWQRREANPTLRAVARTLRTMDLSDLGDVLSENVGLNAAFYLLETLNRIDLPPVDQIPDAEAVRAQGLTHWTVPGTDITIARLEEGDRKGEFLFSRDTVDRADELFLLVQDLPLKRGIPDMIRTWRDAPGLGMPNALAARVWDLPPVAFVHVLHQPLWKWVGALASLCLVVGFVYFAWRAARAWDRRRQRLGGGWEIGQPIAALLALGSLGALLFVLKRVLLFRGDIASTLYAAIAIVQFLVLAWFVAVLITALGRIAVRACSAGAASLDAALLRLCFRLLSLGAALGVLLYAASLFGLSITPIVAGLGVGGLAVALAIRPTLENIFGGFILFGDKPVRVGEFCAFGDKMGTVEAIGLRSTRIRGVDRNVITVPNADFAQLQIVNFSRRDTNPYACKLCLRYETTPDQLRHLLVEIRKLLIRHEKVAPDARVRLTELGPTGYVVDVSASIRAEGSNEFQAVREDLHLRIAELARDSGTALAYPSQTLYLARDPGIDRAQGEASAEEVRTWKRQGRYPFPEFDFAEAAEMADTIPFPPEGSPDHRPGALGKKDSYVAGRASVRG
ncbi:MAG: mechanosensitive ion channel family protein [Geminicoccaceae bacterium]